MKRVFILDHLPSPAEDIVKSADLSINLPGLKGSLPLHSAFLCAHSGVLRDMLALCRAEDSTKFCEDASLGVQQAFRGFETPDILLFVALHYQLENLATLQQALAPGRDLAGVMALAAKLDCPRIVQACEELVLKDYQFRSGKGLYHWLGFAGSLGLDTIRLECAAHILADLLNKARGGRGAALDASIQELLETDSLSKEDLGMLLRGMARSTRDLGAARVGQQVMVPAVRKYLAG